MNGIKYYKKILTLSLYCLAGAFLVWYAISPIAVNEKPFVIWKTIYGRLSIIISFICFFWLAYFKVLWKLRWKLFRQVFFDQPNLSGTWMGYLKSDYLKEGKSIDPIKIVFFINQPNFFEIRITSMSSASAFFSFGEILQFDLSNGMIRLLYQYSTQKRVPHSNNEQQGASDLFLYGDFMAGHYWTIVKTSGFIRIHKLSEERFSSFEDADKTVGNSPVIIDCLKAVQDPGLLA
jgi:hypothetical protein